MGAEDERPEPDSAVGPAAGDSEFVHKELSYAVIGACMRVHRELGPGLPESVYQAAVALDLTRSGMKVVREHRYSVKYLDEVVGEFRADFVVEQTVICEFKAVEMLIERHKAQLLSYLKASGLSLGLLVNFGDTSLQYKRVAYTHGKRQ